MHKSTFIAALALIVSAAAAQSQTAEPTPADPAANAMASPEPGANSFTESQARSRIEKNGYSNVANLVKDAEGIWRAKAMKDGKTVEVALDFKGVIVAR